MLVVECKSKQDPSWTFIAVNYHAANNSLADPQRYRLWSGACTRLATLSDKYQMPVVMGCNANFSPEDFSSIYRHDFSWCRVNIPHYKADREEIIDFVCTVCPKEGNRHVELSDVKLFRFSNEVDQRDAKVAFDHDPLEATAFFPPPGTQCEESDALWPACWVHEKIREKAVQIASNMRMAYDSLRAKYDLKHFKDIVFYCEREFSTSPGAVEQTKVANEAGGDPVADDEDEEGFGES